MSGAIAVDLAFLLPSDVAALVAGMNAELLRADPTGFSIDAEHLAHITLVQQCIERSRLDEVAAAAAGVIAGCAPIELCAERTEQGRGACHLVIEPHPALQGLHERMLGALAPFALDHVHADAFLDGGEPARARDVEWVADYRRSSSGPAFVPHVTLGVGPPPVLARGISFVASHLALCRLGRFCTCRARLCEWRLEGQLA